MRPLYTVLIGAKFKACADRSLTKDGKIRQQL